MKYDELAFLNQQLAAMLRDGIPLEGSIKQLCATIRSGELKSEFLQLEADLARGMPIAKAVAARRLPEFYSLMVQIGARTSDMPGMLTLLADYYHAAHLIWARLKGIMVYPVLVLIMSLGLSVTLALSYGQLADLLGGDARDATFAATITSATGQLWLPPLILFLTCAALIACVSFPSVRRELAWRIPAFKEASLARFASAMSMLLGAGCTLDQSLALLQEMEKRTTVGADLARWRRHSEEGHGKFRAIAEGSTRFPPMFIWLLAGAGEDLALGFQRAAHAYQARANYLTEAFLYAVLPSTLLLLGLMIMSQVFPVFRVVFGFQKLFNF